MTPVDYTVKSLKEGSIRFAAEQPENGKTTRVTFYLAFQPAGLLR